MTKQKGTPAFLQIGPTPTTEDDERGYVSAQIVRDVADELGISMRKAQQLPVDEFLAVAERIKERRGRL
jgi:hypothetical protein